MRLLRDAVITVVVLVVVIWIAAYVRIRAGALSADAEPGALERTIAMRLVRLSIPADASRQRNPFEADSEAWRSAVDHYQDHCAICHGDDGHGKTDMGENMYPKVPDLADPDIQRLSDGALFHIIQNGVRWTGMPAWKHEHSPDETWKLVSLMRKLPSLSAEEIQQLEKEQPDSHEKQEKQKGHDHEHPPSHGHAR